MNVLTFLSIPGILFAEIYSTYTVVNLEVIKTSDWFSLYIITGTIFCTLGLGFFMYGIMTMRTLKLFFKKFYIENRCVLVFATTSLFLPLVIRGVLNLLNALNRGFAQWVVYRRMWFELVMYVVGTVIPLSSQLSTLIFGHIRKRKNEKY